MQLGAPQDLVTVVLLYTDGDSAQAIQATVTSVLNQSHRKLELLLVYLGAQGRQAISATDPVKDRHQDHRVRYMWLPWGRHDSPRALNAAFKLARGTYVRWRGYGFQGPEASYLRVHSLFTLNNVHVACADTG